MKQVYLSMGSNIAPKLLHLQTALAELRLLPHTAVSAVSKVYFTQAVDCPEPEPFYNLCVALETELAPELLLEYTRNIEAKLGRARSHRNAPRTIDIDLLLYEGVAMETKTLTLPHPRMNNRAFVLIPLLEIAEDALRPTLKKHLKKIKDQAVSLCQEQM